MKKLLSFGLLFLTLIIQSNAQQQQWAQYNDVLAQTTFSMPTTAIIATEDSSKLKMYASEVDSLLGLQVHIIDSAYLDGTDQMITEALTNNNYDTLRAMTQLLLLATNSSLTSINDININGRVGLEVGIEYNELASNIPTLTFMRFFLLGDKLVFYTISGSSDDMTRLMSYKNIFFSPINFN